MLSLVNQSVPYWQCHIVVRVDLTQVVSALVKSLATEKASDRLRFVIHSTLNNTIAHAVHVVATQVATSAQPDIKAPWMVVLRSDTQLASHATYSYLSNAFKQPEAKLIYGDHDQIDLDGLRQNPFFKPEFSLDLLYSQNYIGPIFAVQAQYLLALNHKNIDSNQSFALAAILEVVRAVGATHLDRNTPLDYRKHL